MHILILYFIYFPVNVYLRHVDRIAAGTVAFRKRRGCARYLEKVGTESDKESSGIVGSKSNEVSLGWLIRRGLDRAKTRALTRFSAGSRPPPSRPLVARSSGTVADVGDTPMRASFRFRWEKKKKNANRIERPTFRDSDPDAVRHPRLFSTLFTFSRCVIRLVHS